MVITNANIPRVSIGVQMDICTWKIAKLFHFTGDLGLNLKKGLLEN